MKCEERKIIRIGVTNKLSSVSTYDPHSVVGRTNIGLGGVSGCIYY